MAKTPSLFTLSKHFARKENEIFLYLQQHFQFLNSCWESQHLNFSPRNKKRHLISPLFMQKVNTASSKIKPNLTSNLQGKGSVLAIREIVI